MRHLPHAAAPAAAARAAVDARGERSDDAAREGRVGRAREQLQRVGDPVDEPRARRVEDHEVLPEPGQALGAVLRVLLPHEAHVALLGHHPARLEPARHVLRQELELLEERAALLLAHPLVPRRDGRHPVVPRLLRLRVRVARRLVEHVLDRGQVVGLEGGHGAVWGSALLLGCERRGAQRSGATTRDARARLAAELACEAHVHGWTNWRRTPQHVALARPAPPPQTVRSSLCHSVYAGSVLGDPAALAKPLPSMSSERLPFVGVVGAARPLVLAACVT